MLSDGSSRARFWFSRVLLVQALTIRYSYDPRTEVNELIVAARDDEHPFVRDASRLCERALNKGDLGKYVWDDIIEVTAHAPDQLAMDTSRLWRTSCWLSASGKTGVRARAALGIAASLPARLSKTKIGRRSSA